MPVVFPFLDAGRCWARLCLLSGFLAHRCSLLVQFEDSEEDFDSRFDTDDELSYRRDSVYSCVTLPYFHSFLYMKGTSCSHQGAGVWVKRWDVEAVFSLRLMEGVGNITLPTPHLVSGSLAARRMPWWCDLGDTVTPGRTLPRLPSVGAVLGQI